MEAEASSGWWGGRGMKMPSDEVLGIVVPIMVYWVYSGMYLMLGSMDKYRLHSRKDEHKKNLVSKLEVAKTVLLQQLVQAGVAFLLYKASAESGSSVGVEDSGRSTPAHVIIRQFVVAMFVVDTWQYMWHRLLHVNKFLYKHIHSWHHRLVVPYSFGSQYNHPVEGLLMDTFGGALAFLISGMSARTSIFFFSFSVIKGIDDHCGLWLPGNVFHIFFWNNTAYHDIHHQLIGTKYNYAQPFFVTWDKIFGTYMPYTLVKRPDGGFEARPELKL